MFLYLLRHADAEASAESDSARKLTDKGIAQAKRVGDFLKKNGIVPEAILTSPFKRTLSERFFNAVWLTRVGRMIMSGPGRGPSVRRAAAKVEAAQGLGLA